MNPVIGCSQKINASQKCVQVQAAETRNLFFAAEALLKGPHPAIIVTRIKNILRARVADGCKKLCFAGLPHRSAGCLAGFRDVFNQRGFGLLNNFARRLGKAAQVSGPPPAADLYIYNPSTLHISYIT